MLLPREGALYPCRRRHSRRTSGNHPYACACARGRGLGGVAAARRSCARLWRGCGARAACGRTGSGRLSPRRWKRKATLISAKGERQKIAGGLPGSGGGACRATLQWQGLLVRMRRKHGATSSAGRGGELEEEGLGSMLGSGPLKRRRTLSLRSGRRVGRGQIGALKGDARPAGCGLGGALPCAGGVRPCGRER